MWQECWHWSSHNTGHMSHDQADHNNIGNKDIITQILGLIPNIDTIDTADNTDMTDINDKLVK